jgi:hypothetical protein
MIDVPFSHPNYLNTDQEPEAVQQYVRALLSRQHALDLLETIHQQINQVWGNIRKLLEGSAAARLTQAVRVARAAQVVQAKSAYRSLEKRREECIAALHQAERRANAALQALLVTPPERPAPKTHGFRPSGLRPNNRLVSRAARRKSKNSCSEHC